MKRVMRTVLVAFQCLSACFVGSFSPLLAAQRSSSPAPYREDRIIILPKADVTTAQLEGWNQAHHVQELRVRPHQDNLHVVKPREGSSVDELIEQYRASGLVEIAEPDYILTASTIPNDPALVSGTAWALRNYGQDGGLAGADIGIEPLWSKATNSTIVVVAIVDSGIRSTHEDLAGNLWVNSGEVPGNGIDDDADGIVDDVHGMNAVAGSGDPVDDLGHGTHVAGIIGAVANNGKGSLGVAWNVRLMALRFMDANGEGSTSDAIECMDYARTHGAKIINASWGGAGASQALRRALDRARSAGIIVVAAAANDGTDNDTRPVYPASYPLDNIVTVAATDRTDQLASFSNYGRASVDLAAPGVDIYSTWKDHDSAYQTASGTSMAAPFVTGVLAALESSFPDKHYAEVMAAILKTTDAKASLTGKTVSGGRINAARAFEALAPAAFPSFELQISSDLSAGLLTLHFAASPNTTCTMEESSDLTAWTVLLTGQTDAAGAFIANVSHLAGQQRFYRVLVQE